MSRRQIIADQNIPGAADFFGPFGDVRLVDGRALDPEVLGDAQAMIVRSVTRVDENLLQDSSIEFVGSATSGLDHIDLEYLASRNIAFAHAPGANANSVVEYALTALAAVGDTLEQLFSGGTVGVVGYGAIGKALCDRLQNLGISHCVYDPWLDPGVIPHPAGLEEVLACKVVSLHPELTCNEPWPSYHLLDTQALARMDESQLLINASRGEVVDNRALARRLEQPSPPRVVLDVWEGEPAIDRALLDRVMLGTPHVAGYSLDAKIGGTRMIADALAACWHTQFRSRVNPLPAPSPLTVASQLGAAGVVRSLLDQRYDIRRDDALLRASVMEPDPAAAFDKLRKNYRERREVAGSVVSLRTESPEMTRTIEAMACQAVL